MKTPKVSPDSFSLRYLGDPVLWEKCVEVASLADVPPGLVAAMRAVVARFRGAGLAANQVGGLVRVALIGFGGGERHICYNPRIVARSPETSRELEGCLSIPRWETTVERPRTVDLEYRDASFTLKRVTLGGFSARCAVHECDHLDGKLIVDGLSRQQRRQAERFTAKHRADGAA